jgi:hypothetical protein
MRYDFATPRSISALKAAASKLRKASPALTQTAALNKAAESYGFANYQHAQRILPDVLPALTLRCRWYDETGSGTEALKYPMCWTAEQVVAMRLKGARIAAFEAFDGGLFHSITASSRYMARYWLVQALRELMVMEATGLRPDLVKNRLPKVRQEFSGIRYYEGVQPPGADHLSAWYDPLTNATLLMDEPYLEKDEAHSRVADRMVWCERFNFVERASSWGGTHLPPRTRLFLFAKPDSGIDLAAIETTLNTLPDDFGSADEDWQGYSENVRPGGSEHARQAVRQLIDIGYLDEQSEVTNDGHLRVVRLQL